MLNEFIKQAIILMLITSCVPLVLCSVNSLIIAVIQAATQIQEQSITYLVKLSTIMIVYYFCSGWFFSEYVHFFESCLSSVRQFGVYK